MGQKQRDLALQKQTLRPFQLQNNLLQQNTPQTGHFGISEFLEWRNSRNSNFPSGSLVPDTLLENVNIDELSKWLSFYVIDTRSCKGKKYPPKTLYQLLCGLLRYARTKTPNFPNFWDVNDTKFLNLEHFTIQ